MLYFYLPNLTAQLVGLDLSVGTWPSKSSQGRRCWSPSLSKTPHSLGDSFCGSFPSLRPLPTPSLPLDALRGGREEKLHRLLSISNSPSAAPFRMGYVCPLAGRRNPVLPLGLPSLVPSVAHLAQAFELAVWALCLHFQLPLGEVVENNTLFDVSH